HRPRRDLKAPDSDYDFDLPPFWKEGPHFALFVGLTDGEDTFDLQRKIGEMSVLIHDANDVVRLQSPDEADYERWCEAFLAESADRFGPAVRFLSDDKVRSQIAATLRRHFSQVPTSERILRNWTKMAGFAPAILMSRKGPVGREELLGLVEEAAREVAGEVM